MRHSFLDWSAALAVIIGPLCAQTSQPSVTSATGIAGCWRGEARQAGDMIESFLEIALGGGDQVSIQVTIPRSALRRAVVGGATYRDGVLVLDASALGGEYRGTLTKDGRRITGSFKGAPGTGTVALDFERVAGLPDAYRPQEPKRPYPYRDEEVSFVNEQAGIRFFGTLTLPNGPGPHPAAVMITGAGCQDRDERVGQLRPFLVIADHLTRKGIAVLRSDDRGFGKTGGNFLESTSEDAATDTLAAVAYLGSRRDIDRSRIGVIGHSEGGMVAMIAASRPSEIRFVVSLAGVAVKCETLAHESFTALANANRVAKPLAIGGGIAISAIIAMMKSSLTDAQLAAQLRLFLPHDLVPLLASRWTRFMVRYDPTPAIEKVTCPILGVYCAEDVQVPAKMNAGALAAATTRSGNKDVTIVTFPRLDHLFQIAAPTPADAPRLGNTVAPEVLEKMSDWLVERIKPAPTGSDSRR